MTALESLVALSPNDVEGAVAWARRAHAGGMSVSALGQACEIIARMHADPARLFARLAELRRELEGGAA